MQTRKIKVQTQVTPGTLFRQPSKVGPKLTLAGDWLQKAGFPPGTETEIEVREGELVIRAKEAPRRATGAPWAEVSEELSFYHH